MSFQNFNLHPNVAAGFEALGYVEPTPIQQKAIPPILDGKDVIGLAQTGTGKTAAFVLPILERLQPGPRGHVRALIISPTRELAEQIYEATRALGKKTGLKSAAIYGGVNMNQQIQKLHHGIEIVVACPGRLLDHLWKGTINLSELEILVIDEADRMFDMGFQPDVRKILSCILKPTQTLLFSATMPDDIRHLVKEFLRNPVTVQVDRAAPANTVSHTMYPVKQHQKIALLKEILRRTETDSVLIFTRTKHRAERIARQLVQSGYRATALQGNMSQHQRKAALDGFRNGYYKILVATDIAARGIDVLDISHVVNFDMPDGTDSYTHRIGRTGRIGNTGNALTLVTNEDQAMVSALERLLKAPLEQRTLDGFDYTMPTPSRNFSASQRRSPQRKVLNKQAR